MNLSVCDPEVRALVVGTGEALRVSPSQQRPRLDKEERFFPGSNHPGQEHQKKPVRLSLHRAFDLSPQDEQLVTKECVFRQQFSLASGQIGKRAGHQEGRRRFDPTQNTFLEHMKTEAHSPLDRGKQTQHK